MLYIIIIIETLIVSVGIYDWLKNPYMASLNRGNRIVHPVEFLKHAPPPHKSRKGVSL